MPIGALLGLGGLAAKGVGLIGSGKVRGLVNRIKNRKANGGIFGGKLRTGLKSAFGGGGANVEDERAVLNGYRSLPTKTAMHSETGDEKWYKKYLWALIAGPLVLIGAIVAIVRGSRNKNKRRGGGI